jgi:hypothetical protein
MEKAIGFQFPQLSCKSGLGYPIQPTEKLAEPLDLIKGDIPQNQYFPFTAENGLELAHRNTPGLGFQLLKFISGHVFHLF